MLGSMGPGAWDCVAESPRSDMSDMNRDDFELLNSGSPKGLIKECSLTYIGIQNMISGVYIYMYIP